ncbi:MAG: hypothetical protein ACTH31_04305 [Pseudoclavibacter sp.]
MTDTEPLGAGEAADLGAAADPGAAAGAALTSAQLATLERVLRVAYPHTKLPDGPYARAAQTIVDAEPTPGLVTAAVSRLDARGFNELDDASATRTLRDIQATPFFKHLLATAVVALYDDQESWAALGYEGASFDRGGYINRGFNDLDWLPEPRIEENTDEKLTDIVEVWDQPSENDLAEGSAR